MLKCNDIILIYFNHKQHGSKVSIWGTYNKVQNKLFTHTE